VTTIAWDGKTLAADRLCSSNGVRRTFCKIHDCGAYYYAGAGALEDVIRIAEWIRGGAKAEDRPDLDEGGGWGLAIDRPTGHVFHVTGKRVVLARFLDAHHAEGSGRDFALSAMALGMSAVDAVKHAARFDIGTGDDVDSVELLRSGS
jgi:hypothetical protein